MTHFDVRHIIANLVKDSNIKVTILFPLRNADTLINSINK